ncbi:MAG TPA: stage II sporulation protein R [Bacillota bacterium]|nr:stage II sporulation protein R [Bacillota bacterium]
MKKWILLLLSMSTIVYLTTSRPVAVANQPEGIPTKAEELIRFHVVANSDSTADQALKRQVRDTIVQYMAPEFRKAKSIEEAREIAKANLGMLEKLAALEVREAGEKYSVRASLGQFMFPTKTYGKFSLPAGQYEAVKVVLGKGEGANWWCVLFPPLCFVDLTNGLAANPALLMQNNLKTDADSSNVKAGQVSNDPEKGKIEIRFLLGELFNKFVK